MNTETIIKKVKVRISVTDDVTRILIKEFEVTGNTVRWALKFYSDSELSINIRNRAIELMEEVVKKNATIMSEYDQD